MAKPMGHSRRLCHGLGTGGGHHPVAAAYLMARIPGGRLQPDDHLCPYAGCQLHLPGGGLVFLSGKACAAHISHRSGRNGGGHVPPQAGCAFAGALYDRSISPGAIFAKSDAPDIDHPGAGPGGEKYAEAGSGSVRKGMGQ